MSPADVQLFYDLRAAGVSNRLARAVMRGEVTPEAALEQKQMPTRNAAPSPTSNRSLNMRPDERELLKRFEAEIGDRPADRRAIATLFHMHRLAGTEITMRALEKAADVDGFETSEEVIHAANEIVAEWRKAKLFVTKHPNPNPKEAP